MKNKILLVFVLFFTDSIIVTELFSQRYQYDQDYSEPVEEDFYDEGKEHPDDEEWNAMIDRIKESAKNDKRPFWRKHFDHLFVLAIFSIFGFAFYYSR